MRRTILLLAFVMPAFPVEASSEERDILDRRDVQSILFGNGSYGSYGTGFENSNVFRAEILSAQESFTAGAFYLRQLHDYVRSQWGLTYEEGVHHDHIVSLKGVLLLHWDRYFIKPFTGIDAGISVYPKMERNLFSHAILGLDLQVSRNFGLSTREIWSFPKIPYHWNQDVRFRFENALFEVVFYWQI